MSNILEIRDLVVSYGGIEASRASRSTLSRAR